MERGPRTCFVDRKCPFIKWTALAWAACWDCCVVCVSYLPLSLSLVLVTRRKRGARWRAGSKYVLQDRQTDRQTDRRIDPNEPRPWRSSWLSYTEAVTRGVRACEAGNLSVAVRIDSPSHHVRRQPTTLKRLECNLQHIVFGPGSKQAQGTIEASWWRESGLVTVITAFSVVTQGQPQVIPLGQRLLGCFNLWRTSTV